MSHRTGIGIDFHSFSEGRKLILGGVDIDYPLGLAGHSDGDCLIHAVVDAILGALGKGDIGTHFPDTEIKYKNADSTLFLQEAVIMAARERYIIENIDTTIICEEPKIKPYSERIKNRLSGLLCISTECVNIKGKTTEQMGFLGRKEGIACFAVALLTKEELIREG